VKPNESSFCPGSVARTKWVTHCHLFVCSQTVQAFGNLSGYREHRRLPTARGHATRAWRGRDQRMPVLNPGFVGQPSQEVNYDRQGDGPPSDRIGERPQPAQAAWARRFGPGRPTWPDIESLGENGRRSCGLMRPLSRLTWHKQRRDADDGWSRGPAEPHVQSERVFKRDVANDHFPSQSLEFNHQ